MATDPGPTPADNGHSAADLAAMQAEIDRLQMELTRFKELAARAQADVQNARARMERESVDMRQFASAELLRKLLPTVDSVQRALQHLPKDLEKHEWVKGIAAIEQEMLRVLADAGLKRMSSLGQPADPSRHEILTVGPGTLDEVIEVFEEGYELGSRVLRPAKVKTGDGSKN